MRSLLDSAAAPARCAAFAQTPHAGAARFRRQGFEALPGLSLPVLHAAEVAPPGG